MNDEPEELSGPLLTRAAAFFSQRPRFLGYWLDLYQREEGLEPQQLARHLGCTPEDLLRLALCGRPARERLFEELHHLSRRFSVNPDRLADLLQDADLHAARLARHTTGEALPTAAWGAAFAAASDREPEEEPPTREAEDGG